MCPRLALHLLSPGVTHGARTSLRARVLTVLRVCCSLLFLLLSTEPVWSVRRMVLHVSVQWNLALFCHYIDCKVVPVPAVLFLLDFFHNEEAAFLAAAKKKIRYMYLML